MLLTNFFQLSQDLDKNLYLFYKSKQTQKAFPIRKINLTANSCELICKNGTAKTLGDLAKMLGKIKQKNIPLTVHLLSEDNNIYGFQIDNQQNRIYLR